MKDLYNKPESLARSYFLDIYRIILCIGVVVYHYTPIRPACGPFMVNGFFVMSGFLLALEFQKKPFSLLEFYDKKVRRLVPFLIVALIFGVVFRIFQKHPLPDFFSWGAFDLVSFIMYYNTPLWYMAVELILLLLSPFFIYLMNKKLLNVFTLLMMIVTAYIFSKVNSNSLFAEGLYFSPFARSWQFLLGMSTASLLCRYERMIFFDSKQKEKLTICLLVLFIIVAVITMFLKQGTHLCYWNYTFSFNLISSGFMAILIAFLYNKKEHFSHVTRKVLCYLSLLTYPVYLMHMIIFLYVSVIMKHIFGLSILCLNITMSIVCSIICAMTMLYVEKKIKNYWISRK